MIHDGKTKYVLREAMKETLPRKIYARNDKMGFVTPEDVWIKENPVWFTNELTAAVDNSKGFINKSVLNRVNEVINEKVKFDFILWRAIAFGRWLRAFNVMVN